MERYINENAIILMAKIIKTLIANNKLEEALDVAEKYISPVSNELTDAIILNKNQLSELKMNQIMGTISWEDAGVKRRNIAHNLLNIIDQVHSTIETQQMNVDSNSTIYYTTSDENLEKILGSESHLVKINWLHKAIKASKSVCQVVCSDGSKGTGFLLKDGYLMTNSHVLPDIKSAVSAKIIFNYEDDVIGHPRKTSEYLLVEKGAAFSPENELDYAYIKIKDNPETHISQWGFLELDTFSDPQKGQPVNIIQHPLGESKQIALTANKIIAVDKPKLFYQTDTEEGSSGSPVFNSDWKVIALHHAGRTKKNGGLIINQQTGERRGSNEGILIKQIVHHIGKSI